MQDSHTDNRTDDPEPRLGFAASKPPMIDISDINFSFGTGQSKKQVLFDCNLTMYPGEIVIMTGPSGSGKTTLLTLIGALRSVQEGSLKILGKELKGLGQAQQEKARTNIGFIFQAHNLLESLTAYQNVKLATELTGVSPKEADALAIRVLTDLGIKERMYDKPKNLSGGQRQRVAIGRALVNKPKIILADEPTAALDKDTGRQVVTLLQNLANEQGCTILIVTHDNRILDVADRIIKMVDGYVISNVNVKDSITLVHFLQKCPVFAESSPAFLAEIAKQMLLEKHTSGTEVIRQGEVGDKFYVVRSGRLDVLITQEGKTSTVTTLKTGDFFGELALLNDEPRKATVKAIEDVELLILSKKLFLEAVEHNSNLEAQLKKAYFNA